MNTPPVTDEKKNKKERAESKNSAENSPKIEKIENQTAKNVTENLSDGDKKMQEVIQSYGDTRESFLQKFQEENPKKFKDKSDQEIIQILKEDNELPLAEAFSKLAKKTEEKKEKVEEKKEKVDEKKEKVDEKKEKVDEKSDKTPENKEKEKRREEGKKEKKTDKKKEKVEEKVEEDEENEEGEEEKKEKKEKKENKKDKPKKEKKGFFKSVRNGISYLPRTTFGTVRLGRDTFVSGIGMMINGKEGRKTQSDRYKARVQKYKDKFKW